MSDLFEQTYNPDVLSCLANLSNDEVFTPPEVANQMLDLLSEEIWHDSSATFLDPACKSGVFLREIAKRLIDGLEDEFPELPERLDHIFRKQIFGIATTELCSLLSRRSVYCSKYPNSKYSVVQFDTGDGNLRYHRCEHTWVGGRCKYCGASQDELGRDADHEAYAYEFIHIEEKERLLPVKFDVVIGNPPYQLNDGGNGASASPIYHKFIEQALRLNPRYLVMIVPSRYLAGGKGLDSFRQKMLTDTRIVKMVDFINAKDCFPQNSVGGGVNYFLWSRDYSGECEYTTVMSGDNRNTIRRSLSEFPVFVRYNQAVEVIRAITNSPFESLSSMVSSRSPFGLPTSTRGHDKSSSGDCVLLSSKGKSYIARTEVEKGLELIDSYKILVSRITYEHAGEPDKEGKLRVLSKILVLEPGEVCTDSYLIIGNFNNLAEANNLASYLKTKFARFLISQTLTSINLSKDKFAFVPVQDWNSPMSDDELFGTYSFTAEQKVFFENLIHSFPQEGE